MSIALHAPQYIYLALLFAGLIWAAHDHGKPRDDQNFWSTLIASSIMFALLYWGGFFTK